MRDGVVADFSVAENLLLVDYGSRAFCRFRVPANPGHPLALRRPVAAFNVKTRDLETPVRNLSGGSIQKLIMARESRADRTSCWWPSRPGIDVSASRYLRSASWRNATAAPRR